MSLTERDTHSALPPARAALPVEITRLSKSYGTAKAVDDVSLSIAPGEFVTLLGPSGSGKTTLLMTIAGFARPDRRLDPHRRQRGRPHAAASARHRHGLPELRLVSAYERRRQYRLSAEAAACRARREIAAPRRRALDLVQLPAAASGASTSCPAASVSAWRCPRHRLRAAHPADGRAALGARQELREEMQIEIRRLHRRLGTTTIAVTHDQREAMTMSDRVAVLHEGRVMQFDTPRDSMSVRPAASSPSSSANRASFRWMSPRVWPAMRDGS